MSKVIPLRCTVTAEELSLREQQAQPAEWRYREMAGRFVELSGEGALASLTIAAGLVWEAQLEGEPVAWITREESCFFPPDLEESGIDLEALIVVRVPDAGRAGRAADRLIRSGAFGLIVADLGRDAELPIPLQGRLSKLVQKHDTALVCLTEKGKERPSIGSMVSLRADVLREVLGEGRFRCKVKVLKDKHRGPNWDHEEVVHGPSGLR